jgi:nucleotide-binding universal stress UspA family protein
MTHRSDPMPAPIIVGLALRDDDAAPLAFARQLAAIGDVPLVLATALPREAPARFPTPEYSRAIRQDAGERLAAAARDCGGSATTHILDGSPAGELHHLAEQVRAAAVVVGSSHRGAVGRLLIGDVGVSLLHGSACPIAIVPRDYDKHPGAVQRVGVAFEGTPESRAALEAAVGLARRAAGSIHSITVLEPMPWAPSYAWPGPYPSEELNESREQWAQTVADEALATIPDELTGASEVVHGAVVPVLAGMSTELDLLVCGSRGYGSTRQVLAGSVGRGLAHRAACPLLVVPRELSAGGSSLWQGSTAVEAR